MQFIKKIFQKKNETTDPEDMMMIAKIIGPLLDSIANRVFKTYVRTLITEPVTYIVPAVWGADKHNELDPVAREIHAMVSPVIEQAVACLNFKALSPAQEFAIGFLIRGLIISKLAFMVESAKNQTLTTEQQEERPGDVLKNAEPIGSA